MLELDAIGGSRSRFLGKGDTSVAVRSLQASHGAARGLAGHAVAATELLFRGSGPSWAFPVNYGGLGEPFVHQFTPVPGAVTLSDLPESLLCATLLLSQLLRCYSGKGTMASILQVGDKWRAQIRRTGNKSIAQSFASKKDAERWARAEEARMDAKKGPLRDDMTLGELIEEYRKVRAQLITGGGRRTRRPSQEELASLLDYLSIRVPVVADAVRVAAVTGLRRGELARIAWDDLDPKEKAVYQTTSYIECQYKPTTVAVAAVTCSGTSSMRVPAATPVRVTATPPQTRVRLPVLQTSRP